MSMPFAPLFGGKTTVIAASVSSVSATQLQAGGDVLITNPNNSIAYVNFSGTPGLTAIVPTGGVSDMPIPANSSRVVNIGAAKYVAVILGTGTGNVLFTPGRGLN